MAFSDKIWKVSRDSSDSVPQMYKPAELREGKQMTKVSLDPSSLKHIILRYLFSCVCEENSSIRKRCMAKIRKL